VNLNSRIDVFVRLSNCDFILRNCSIQLLENNVLQIECPHICNAIFFLNYTRDIIEAAIIAGFSRVIFGMKGERIFQIPGNMLKYNQSNVIKFGGNNGESRWRIKY
jgi:hypothetical protein